MKINWNPNLDYQNDAVNCVINLFKGQNPMNQYFTISGLFTLQNEVGIGNMINISKEDILYNLNQIQYFNHRSLSQSLSKLDFSIEMAEGTGKTYVYLKTIFELNKKYGFTKFIIVSKSFHTNYIKSYLDDSKEHFKSLYDNIIYDYFVFDSSKLQQVINFAESSNINIMIISINYLNSIKTNNIYKNDKLRGYKPIDLITNTNPIVIIDEPEHVMNGNGKKVIDLLNPLCTLKYSSKHEFVENLIYKFDFMEAYDFFRLRNFELICDNELNLEIKMDLIAKLDEYLFLKKYDDALFLIDILIKIDDSNEFWINKANILIKLHKFNEALNCFEEVLQNNDEDFKTILNKANLLMSLNRFADAIDCYKLVLSGDRSLGDAEEKMYSHICNHIENTGFYAVSQFDNLNNHWVYTYMDDNQFKQLFGEDINQLRRKVYDNNLIWAVLDKNLARQSQRKDLVRGNLND